MGSVKYFIKGSRSPSTIHVRFYHGREYDFAKSTSLLIDPKYWNNKKGEVRKVAAFSEKVNLQNKLNGLKSNLLNQFNDLYSEGNIIDSDWFETSIREFFDQDYEKDFRYFLDYTDHYFDTIPKKVLKSGQVGVAVNTLKRYRTVINKLIQFEHFKKRRYRINEVNLKYYREFKDFLIDVEKLNHNTTGRYLTYLKTICKDGRKEGFPFSSDVERSEFRETKESTSFITLDFNEIQAIKDFDFRDQPYLDKARDWLIIGFWTGARVSDLFRFTSENIENDFLEYASVKTGKKVMVPLHPDVKSILEKHGGHFPNAISSQRFNEYIKEVCKRVEINEMVEGSKKVEIQPGIWRKRKGLYPKWDLVSSHICRRSFATNHYGKLPTPVLMAITGHSTEKMFLNYIGKTPNDYAKELKAYWDRN